MQPPPPNPPDKEGPSLSRLERRGLPGPVSVKQENVSRETFSCFLVSQEHLQSEVPLVFRESLHAFCDYFVRCIGDT